MNNKLYHSIIDITNIILRFMVSFTLISILILIANLGSASVIRTLCLFPAPIISYLISKNTKHLWSFLILHVLLLLAYILTTSNLIISIFYGLYLILMTITEFRQKLEPEKIGKSNTSLLFVSVFFLMNLCCNYLKLTELNPLFFGIAIVYVLLYFLNLYLINFESFFQIHANMSNVPIQQIKNANNTLIVFFGSFCFCVMLIFTQLPFGGLLSLIGRVLLRIFRVFFSMFHNDVQEVPPAVETADANTTNSFQLMEPSEPSALVEFIQKVLLGLVTLAIIAAIIALLVYSIYKLYQLFYKKKENNFRVKTEFISPFEKREQGKNGIRNSSMKRFQNLFGKSNNDKIRKHFYKAVSTHLDSTKHISNSLTPSQLSKYAFTEGSGILAGTADPEKMKQLTDYYEKARYSNEECNKDEVLLVKNILK